VAAAVVVGVGGVGVKGATVVAALWAVPLASAPSRSDRLARICGGTVDMVNVGSRAPVCSLLILRCARGGPLPYKASAPDQDADWIGFSIPEIFTKGKEITFLTPWCHRARASKPHHWDLEEFKTYKAQCLT
jgi:hypothetical protein